MDPVLKAQCLQTVNIQFPTATAPDAYGQLTAGTATAFLCRVEPDDRSEERFSIGSELRSEYCILIDETCTGLTLDCLFFLPGISSSSATFARRPQKIQQFVDELGSLDHWEVYV